MPIRQLAGLGLGAGDEILQRAHRGFLAHGEDEDVLEHLAHRLDLLRPERHRLGHERRIGQRRCRGEHHLVAVGRGIGQRREAHQPAAAVAIDHRPGLAGDLRCFARERPGHRIDAAAGGIGHDHFHVLGRILILRQGVGQAAAGQKSCGGRARHAARKRRELHGWQLFRGDLAMGGRRAPQRVPPAGTLNEGRLIGNTCVQRQRAGRSFCGGSGRLFRPSPGADQRWAYTRTGQTWTPRT